MSLGFIILRNVRCETTNEYWIECYNCIRRFYPTNKILIIDDNSNYKFITDVALSNTLIINSEYKGRGELLPYLYYLQNRLFDRAVILHDSVFIQKYIEFNSNKFLWDFIHQWDNENAEKNIIRHLDNHDGLLTLYDQKHNWKGCFGVMSCISYDLLNMIDHKYKLSKLINCIRCRDERMWLERVFAVMFTYENKFYDQSVSYFGNIHDYCRVGSGFDSYKTDRNIDDKPIIKVWSGR